MEKQIFRVGDRVFSIFYGWGTVEAIANRNLFPVEVRFAIGRRAFKHSGHFADNAPATLSFTEYDMINGGFSTQRPTSEFCVKTFLNSI